VWILGVSGSIADGAAPLRLEQQGRAELSRGLTSNLRVPTGTKPQASPTNPDNCEPPLTGITVIRSSSTTEVVQGPAGTAQ
jgi:hypothetical protein